MSSISAVVFDLDDTLIAERQYVESGYGHIADVLSCRIDVDSKTIYTVLCDLFASSAKNVFNRLYDKLGIPYTKEDIMGLVAAYRNHMPDIQFYDDVLPLLETLKSMNIKTGIISDGYIQGQRNKLKALNADRLFDDIIVTEELGREYWKPHPRAFEVMRERLNVRFEEMIYVGDNPRKDFFIGSIYPIRTVRVCRDGVYEGVEYLDGVKETYTVNSLAEIPALLNAAKGE